MGFFSKLFSGNSVPDPDVADATAVLHGKTIVGVEPSLTISKVIGLTLTEAGVNWHSFNSSELLFQEASTLDPALAILSVADVGSEVSAILNQVKSEFKGIKVLLLTDIANRIDSAEALRLGADAVLIKPFSAKKLLATVANLFRSPWIT